MSDTRGSDPVKAVLGMGQAAGNAIRDVGGQAQQAGTKALGEGKTSHTTR